jgi:putative methionine-R-sulfoxide reductase with GAF domain
MLEIGILLTEEHNTERLMKRVIDTAMDIAECDGGTLYLKENIGKDEVLKFKIMITLSKGFYKGTHGDTIELPPVPVNSETHICACAARTAKIVNVADVYTNERFDFSGTKEYDKINSYTSRSMVAVPMKDENGEIIGVIQLINALDGVGKPIPFSEESVFILTALASQSAIVLNNSRLIHGMQDMFGSFIHSLSTAIEERSVYTANHTRHMAKYGAKFLQYIRENGIDFFGINITDDLTNEFITTVWVHDIGKLTIPIEVMDKPTRLGDSKTVIETRIDYADVCNEMHFAKGEISREVYEERKKLCERVRKRRKLSMTYRT